MENKSEGNEKGAQQSTQLLQKKKNKLARYEMPSPFFVFLFGKEAAGERARDEKKSDGVEG